MKFFLLSCFGLNLLNKTNNAQCSAGHVGSGMLYLFIRAKQMLYSPAKYGTSTLCVRMDYFRLYGAVSPNFGRQTVLSSGKIDSTIHRFSQKLVRNPDLDGEKLLAFARFFRETGELFCVFLANSRFHSHFPNFLYKIPDCKEKPDRRPKYRL